MILTSFIITFLVNVAGDILLIPFFKNEGAAFAFLAACLVQTIYYLRKNAVTELKNAWYQLIACTLCALLSGFLSRLLFPNSWVILPSAIVFYTTSLFITSQIRLTDRKDLKQLFNW